MYWVLVVIFAVLQLTVAQDVDPVRGRAEFTCFRTADNPPQNVLEVAYIRGADDPVVNLYVMENQETPSCQTTTLIPDDNDGKLSMRLNDLKEPIANTDGTAVCGISLTQTTDGGQQRLILDKDVIFLITRQTGSVHSSKDWFFKVLVVNCNFDGDRTAQTVKNIEPITITGMTQNEITPSLITESLTLLVLRKKPTDTNYAIETKTVELNDELKIRVDMALPQKTAYTKFRVKSLKAYKSCGLAGEAVMLMEDYCAVNIMMQTDITVGFANTLVNDANGVSQFFRAEMVQPFVTFIFDTAETVCFAAEVEFCTTSDTTCDGDTCKSKATGTVRRRRSADNATSSVFVTAKISITEGGDDAVQGSSKKSDECDAFVHPRVFIPVLTVLLALVLASMMSTVYLLVNSRRQRDVFPMKKLSEENI